MTTPIDFLLDRSSAALLIFATVASLSRIVSLSNAQRAVAGAFGVLFAVLLPISTRSGFEWTVSAIERPSAPGLLLLAVFAVTAVTGRRFDRSAEFRFGTAMLAIGGFFLYPGAIGFLNFDTYVLGYHGYVLPVLLAVILGIAIWRRYFLVVAALDVGIAAFLIGAGRSLNLWDYVIDPVGWFLAVGAWIVIAAGFLIGMVRGKGRQGGMTASYPSSGNGETPISH
jgi:hypothetical protein